ncbi:unnamed protein product [Triticum turgidum subsp. durum]|uniref:FYR C-terminal domain-containing protein n=1 Tax=Triticum turgidum subsp. durum TaxID=4567 RepID=A0A9R0X5N0_TRITD|nr:unnamed protein product [Triticum turgidum subsp. durum]
MAAKEADGDHFIEMVSAGALYRGGEWERKYWSCSRGKDRHPYPVGYHAVRHFSGISYAMEIQQGPRGPVFQVTSTEGDCATGQTPDIAWKNFHKKTGAKVRDWQRVGSFPQKIDGVELFGFKNASVQRLLRQLLVDSTGFGIDMPSPKIYGAASPSTDTVAADVSDDHEEQHVCLDKTVVTAKRSMNPIQEEGTAKRAHNQDMLTSADNSAVELDKSARQSFNKGDPVSNSQLSVVSTPICMPPLLEEIPCDSKCTLVKDKLGDYVPNSSQEDGLSSSSYLGSEKSDLEAAEKEVARSMMTFLLPQAIPLLEKTYRRRKVKQKKKEDAVLARSVAAQNPSADGCKAGATLPTSVGEGNMNGSQAHVHEEPLCEAVKDIGPNYDSMNGEQISKSDDMKAVVADSFEDDGQVGGDSKSKPTAAHHEFDDACSREPNENLKLLNSRRENHAEFSECQVEVHSRKDIPDVVYDHEKGQYILSDSLLACLEEEFGMDDSSHPVHYNHGNGNVEAAQRQQRLKDPKEVINNGFSISTDGAGDNNMGNRHDVSHARSNINHVNGLLSKHPETSSKGSDHHLELMGCYLHPMPVLSIMLNTKDSSSLNIYVLCGSSESCKRFLYVYDITPNDHHEKPPNFVGYTTLLLPSLEQASTGNSTFGRSGIQFTPDGQFLVLLSGIRIPCCRMQSIDCSCSLCKVDQCGDNSLKIVSVNFGYISLLTKLMPSGTVSCFSISEPNYVVAAEDSRNLHVWMMVAGWSVISEEYVISSSGNVGPSILELRKMPTSSSLIIGHDGAGGFCLWDISKRTLLSTFASPGDIVFQILPLGFCSLQEDVIHASVDDIERRLQEITVSDMSEKDDHESNLMLSGKDIAVWIMVSSASVAEYQHDLRAKEHNARWRLALLANNKVLMGNVFDSRATSVDACGNHGFAGTRGGFLYMWELSSGRKLTSTQCFNCSRVSCVAVGAKSSVVAVADDGCQLLLYAQKRV